MCETDNKINEISNKFNNVIYLNNSKYKYGSFNILGTTLWSNYLMIKDHTKYRLNNPELSNKTFTTKFHQNVEWLKNNISKNSIILTHYPPSKQMVNSNIYKDPYSHKLVADAQFLIKPPVKIWLSGHIHIVKQTKINNVLCGINADTNLIKIIDLEKIDFCKS